MKFFYDIEDNEIVLETKLLRRHLQVAKVEKDEAKMWSALKMLKVYCGNGLPKISPQLVSEIKEIFDGVFQLLLAKEAFKS